jgi:hypothetical protein
MVADGKALGQAQSHRLLCEIQPTALHSIAHAAMSHDGRYVAVSGATETLLYSIEHSMEARDVATVARVRVRGADGTRGRLPAAHRLCFGSHSAQKSGSGDNGDGDGHGHGDGGGSPSTPFLLIATRETPTRLLSVALQSSSSAQSTTKKFAVTVDSIVALPLPSSTEEEEDFGPVVSLVTWADTSSSSSSSSKKGHWLACGDAGNVTHVFWSAGVAGAQGQGQGQQGQDGGGEGLSLRWQYYTTLPVFGNHQHTAMAFINFPALARSGLPTTNSATQGTTAALVHSCTANGIYVFALAAKRMLRFHNARLDDADSPLRQLVHPVVGMHALQYSDESSSVLCFGLNFMCRVSLSIVADEDDEEEDASGVVGAGGGGGGGGGKKVARAAKCLAGDYHLTQRYKPLVMARPLPLHIRADFSTSSSSAAASGSKNKKNSSGGDGEGEEDAMDGHSGDHNLVPPPRELVVVEQPWDRVNELLPEALFRTKYAT